MSYPLLAGLMAAACLDEAEPLPVDLVRLSPPFGAHKPKKVRAKAKAAKKARRRNR